MASCLKGVGKGLTDARCGGAVVAVVGSAGVVVLAAAAVVCVSVYVCMCVCELTVFVYAQHAVYPLMTLISLMIQHPLPLISPSQCLHPHQTPYNVGRVPTHVCAS